MLKRPWTSRERMNVFILSQLCRPTVHGLSCLENEQWILYEGIYTQLQNANATSMDCRPEVHGLSADSPWTVGRLQIQSMDFVRGQSMDCVGECEPTISSCLAVA